MGIREPFRAFTAWFPCTLVTWASVVLTAVCSALVLTLRTPSLFAIQRRSVVFGSGQKKKKSAHVRSLPS
jgi:hypothetical protein